MKVKNPICGLILFSISISCLNCSYSTDNSTNLNRTRNNPITDNSQKQSNANEFTDEEIDYDKQDAEARKGSDKVVVFKVFGEILKIGERVKIKYPEQISEWKPIEKDIHIQIGKLKGNLVDLHLLARLCADFMWEPNYATENEVYLETFLECARILAKQKEQKWVRLKLDILQKRISGMAHPSEAFYEIVEGINAH